MKKHLLIILGIFSINLAFSQQFPVNVLNDRDPTNISDLLRIDIVILGDGYTQADMPLFRSDAQDVANAFLNTAPFDQYANYFTFYSIEVPSNESGASHPRNKTDCPSELTHPIETVDNYFGSTFDYGSVHRGLFATNVSAIYNVLADNVSTYHFAMVIVNTPYWGGLNSSAGFPTSTRISTQVPIHEFGHNFADLGDEYTATGGTARERPNVTQETRRDHIKWNHLINSATPIPTPTSVGAGVVGLYEGANYHTTGWFRPELTCMMRASGQPFCAVCRETIVNNIQQSSVCPTIDRIVNENFNPTGDGTGYLRLGFRNITSSSDINDGAWVGFEAGISIVLTEGFHAKIGSTFEASIVSCPVFPCPFGGSGCLGLIENQPGTIEVADLENINAIPESVITNTILYPNPFSNTINIDIHVLDEQDIQLSLVTISGSEVASKKYQGLDKGNNHIAWTLKDRNIQKGIYVLRITSKYFQKSIKIIYDHEN